MFYGAGAGKLPTASAVVADVVDAAKHIKTNIMTLWSSKKLNLDDIKNSEKRFFVRLKGDAKVITLDDVKGEFGVITPVMSEAKYEEAASKASGIITRIRVESV